MDILVDTNIIIEAVRTDCWRALSGHYDLVTVAECAVEAQSGVPGDRGYVPVADEDLRRLRVVPVSNTERARLALACDAASLDQGERDLWAHANAREDDWQATCADQAAVRIAVQLGWGDRLVSLERLLRDAGVPIPRSLRGHYRESTLSSWRTKFRLGM